jgi:hypothetical protein
MTAERITPDEARRLRERAEDVAHLWGSPEPPEDGANAADLMWFAAMDAADLLERLAAEVDSLNHEIMGYQVDGGYDKGHEHGALVAVKYRDEAKRLAADNVRLRAALYVACPAIEILREKCINDEAKLIVQQALDLIDAALSD